MIYWAPFLHFYQPHIQYHSVLRQICRESYRPLTEVFLKNPITKITINISGILSELLDEHGQADILENFKKLSKEGKIEFVESAMYHPILPLIPPGQVRRQIELNKKANRKYFQDDYNVRGFFSPEMCYSNELASLLSTAGYEWMIISGVACSEKFPFNVIHEVKLGENGINIFYRSDFLSNKISFKKIDSRDFIYELLNIGEDNKDMYVITAMDGETFGHHIKNWEKLFLEEVFEIISGEKKIDLSSFAGKYKKNKDITKLIKIVTISELFEKFPVKKSFAPEMSSWSTTKEDIKHGNYYPLWKNKDNPIHNLQWEHVDITLDLFNQAISVSHNKESEVFLNITRHLMDKALTSCQFWWANKTGAWDINLINKGLIVQEEAVFNAYKTISVSNADKDTKTISYRNVVAARDNASRIRDMLLKYVY